VVAIERPDGLLVDRLLEAGVRVLALHPNQVKAARDRFRASGGKSDRFDRFVLCELARTDRHRFRVLEPDSDETKALKALTRAREDLVTARVALANQLRAELERFWPGPIGLFSGEIEMLRRRSIVLRLTRTLQVMVEEISELGSEIADALHSHPDGEIFSSFFRSPDSVICAATLLSEIGDCRARYPHRDAIAADAGQAPVAMESGKRKHAKFRWACNQRLRNALATLAHVTRRWNPLGR
jgi:transposase